jgi:hypothetical protein
MQPIGLPICQPHQVSTTNKGPPTELQEPIGMCCFQGQFNGQPAQFQQQIPPQQQVKLLSNILQQSLLSFTNKATMSRDVIQQAPQFQPRPSGGNRPSRPTGIFGGINPFLTNKNKYSISQFYFFDLGLFSYLPRYRT